MLDKKKYYEGYRVREREIGKICDYIKKRIVKAIKSKEDMDFIISLLKPIKEYIK